MTTQANSSLKSFLMTFFSVFAGYFTIELMTVDFNTILLEKDMKLVFVPFLAAGIRALVRYQDEQNKAKKTPETVAEAE